MRKFSVNVFNSSVLKSVLVEMEIAFDILFYRSILPEYFYGVFRFVEV